MVGGATCIALGPADGFVTPRMARLATTCSRDLKGAGIRRPHTGFVSKKPLAFSDRLRRRSGGGGGGLRRISLSSEEIDRGTRGSRRQFFGFRERRGGDRFFSTRRAELGAVIGVPRSVADASGPGSVIERVSIPLVPEVRAVCVPRWRMISASHPRGLAHRHCDARARVEALRGRLFAGRASTPSSWCREHGVCRGPRAHSPGVAGERTHPGRTRSGLRSGVGPEPEDQASEDSPLPSSPPPRWRGATPTPAAVVQGHAQAARDRPAEPQHRQAEHGRQHEPAEPSQVREPDRPSGAGRSRDHHEAACRGRRARGPRAPAEGLPPRCGRPEPGPRFKRHAGLPSASAWRRGPASGMHPEPAFHRASVPTRSPGGASPRWMERRRE